MRLSGHFVAVATLGFLVIVRVRPVQRRRLHPRLADVLERHALHEPVVDGGWALVVVYVVWRIKRSPYGRDMFAQREDRVAAQAIGIRVMDPRLLAFVVGAFFSAVAGSLYAHFITSFSPTVFYFDLTFRVITMLVIGGMGSVSGSILGAILIVGLGEALRRVEDATLLYGLSSIVLAVIFIVVIIVRPRRAARPARGPARPAVRPGLVASRGGETAAAGAGARAAIRARRRAPSCATGSARPSRARSARRCAPSAMCSSRTRPEGPPAEPCPDPVQLGHQRGVRAEQDLAGGREAEQLARDLGGLAGREHDRLAHVRVDVGEHRGEVGERPDVRVARVEQDDRGGPEPVGEEDAERRRVDEREVEVRVAESRVELDRDALAGRRLDREDNEVVEQRLGLDAQPAVPPGGLVHGRRRPRPRPRGRRAPRAARCGRR